MPEEGTDLVRVGVITGAHGIRGEVKLRSFTANPDQIANYGPLVTSGGSTVEIETLRVQKDGFIARLSGVANRNAAEALKGQELFIARAALPEAQEDEVYVHDLVGMKAKLADGETLGHVVGLVNFGAGDLIEIGRVESEETVFVPFAESYVQKIDRGRKRIVLDLPEGYLDEPQEKKG
ncbi:MAG: ribosome maturation factor RimM [Parvibaculaceae bacterium]